MKTKPTQANNQQAIHDNPSEAQGQPLLNIDPMNGDQGLQHYNFGSAAQEFGGIGMLSPQVTSSLFPMKRLVSHPTYRLTFLILNAAANTRNA